MLATMHYTNWRPLPLSGWEENSALTHNASGTSWRGLGQWPHPPKPGMRESALFSRQINDKKNRFKDQWWHIVKQWSNSVIYTHRVGSSMSTDCVTDRTVQLDPNSTCSDFFVALLYHMPYDKLYKKLTIACSQRICRKLRTSPAVVMK